ncbi:leucine-rich repeat and guanylate kinase domain-containing protein-like isoform X2 [Haliotis rufescens]|uniref:leucine-rich repeat and guanylate kinase domain-containing protein-like isoform X2 n=1 Tax=Haliotis rufescens TaxID=6454 RepID=UPI00201EA392|nr:leucine-rich repeat and guanylate kinase domain-containing protein-like isoform X2 [Haliotis rufescens]
MNKNLKARVAGSLTNTIGRQVGVLPVDPRPRATRKAPSSGGGVVRRAGSGTSVASRQPLSRTSSLTSTNLDFSDAEDGDPKLSSNTNSRQGSSRSMSSRLGSSRSRSSCIGSSRRGSSRTRSHASEEEEKDDRPKKTVEPEEILEQCQERDYNRVYEINLHGEGLTHVADLEKDLRELKLYGNQISVIENLDNLKELCSLQLQHNKIRSIGRGLSCLKKLRTLRLDSNNLLRLETSDLVACVQITVLDLSSNMLDNLSALNYLPNLEELTASNNRLRKVTEIQRCKKLQEVDLSGNRISDLSGLAGLPHLQILDVSSNQLSSLRSLGKLRSLEDLNVSHNKLSDLSYLGQIFPRLQILSICDNSLNTWQDVCDLETMKELVEISLSGNPVTMEDGEMPHYHYTIQTVLPHIEVVDGAHVKRQSMKSAPLMRPMSASSIVSVRQMDTQLKAYAEELKSLEKSIADKFESLRSTCETLPLSLPESTSVSSSLLSPTSSRPASRSRARLREAMDFAAQNS